MPKRKRNSLSFSGIGSQLSALPENANVSPLEKPWEKPFPKPARMSYHVPRLNGALKLLVDPQRDFKLLPRADNENIGADTVANGDFHDFTMLNDANVKGHWIFDDVYHANELTGDALTADQSGNGNDLTAANFSVDFADELTGSNPAYEDGNALQLNGVDQEFLITDLGGEADDLDPGTGSFTFEAWVNINSNETLQNLSGKREGFATFRVGWSVAIGSAEVFYIEVSDGSTELANVGGTSLLNQGWNHVAAVIDKSADELRVYINGEIDATPTDITGLGDISNTETFTIGGRISSADHFSRQISEARISNIARTVQELKESYAIGKSWRTGSGSITPTNQSFAQRFTNSASSTDNMQQVVTTVADTLYKLEFDGYRVSGSGNLTVELSGAHTKTLTFNDTVNTHQVYYFTATTTSLTIDVYGSNAGDVYEIDNITVKPVQNAVQPSSTNVPDRSPFANDGTGQNSLEDDQPGHPAAYLFNGVDQFINFSDVADVGLNDWIDFGWIKATDDGSAHAIFDKTSHKIDLTTDDKLQITIDSTAFTKSSARYKTGDWVFFAVVYDRDDLAYYWKDSALDSTVDISGKVAVDLDNASDFRVGHDGTTYYENRIGLFGRIVFDGNNGSPNQLPENWRNIVEYIREQSKYWMKN